MEPDGIVNACTANGRMTRASSTAMMIASPYSRNERLLARAFAPPPATEADASGGSASRYHGAAVSS